MVRSLILELNTLKLERVNGSSAHALILYNILKKRDTKTNISHKKIPTLKQHVNFINSLPYRYWFIIKKSSSVLGSISQGNLFSSSGLATRSLRTQTKFRAR